MASTDRPVLLEASHTIVHLPFRTTSGPLQGAVLKAVASISQVLGKN